jgi:PKD repeat protein
VTDNDPTIDVSASATGGTSPYTYAWDFGDGTNATGQTTSHTYTADGTYTISLTVTDNDGETDTVTQQVTITGIAPSAPTGLTAQATDQARIDLSWAANSEGDIDGYHVYYSTSPFSDPANATQATVSPSSGTSYELTGLTKDTTYYVRITAVDTSGNESAVSAEVSATTLPDVTVGTASVDNTAPTPGETITMTLAGATADCEVWWYDPRGGFDAQGLPHSTYNGTAITDDDGTQTYTFQTSISDEGDYEVAAFIHRPTDSIQTVADEDTSATIPVVVQQPSLGGTSHGTSAYLPQTRRRTAIPVGM